MATFAAEVKLFGKWSFEDVEVRTVTPGRSPAGVGERVWVGNCGGTAAAST